MFPSERKYLRLEPAVAWSAFVILLACYWSTVAPTVSFWDCPEYVAAAYLLEVGHPPGNPVWMLVERIATLCAPPQYAALAVNLSSGLFTAFAAFFIAKTIFRVGLWVLLKLPRRRIPAPVAAAGAALTGALAFGWCDSVWYSAVEAEVYAMSIFMTSLCVWLMTKWAGTSNRGDSWRLLVLIAYLFGLSIGIHQLNLLCIPALALIWAIRRGIRSVAKLFFIFLISLLAVACILTGMMPSTISLAARFELFAVNDLNLPAISGVVIYIIMLGASLLCALWAVGHSQNRIVMGTACFPAIFLSGIFIFSDRFLIGALLSVIVAALLVSGSNFKARRLYLSIWMLAMLLTGYSSYALIPIRGMVPSPANASMPDDPFSFAAYQNREQYGTKPLIYGPTPYSANIFQEEVDTDGHASYINYAIDYSMPIYVAKEEGGRLKNRIRGLSSSDSVENLRLLAREGDAYIIRGRKAKNVKTPELNMWFPRITSHSDHDLLCYEDWVGMDSASMVRVPVSEAVDSAGNFVTRLDSDGRRREAFGLRPSYLHNLQWFLSYQTAYMYWRYLMWNFVGRQNDRPSQGEVQHGNFITGFTPLDNAMLGAEDKLPDVAGSKNKGRNRYFGLPLILGILGILWLLNARRRGMQACGVIAVLFIMTGLAITVYLNQDPAEPRERDYSFLGSYLAYSIWIGFGAVMIARSLKSAWGFLIPIAITVWMCYENYDDHDRSNRYVARNFAVSLLESLEPEAVVFVTGDNYTFPLWYAQEVEGVRRDVRVINLVYLNTPPYVANLLADWRDSKALPTVLTRGDIMWDAFRSSGVPLYNSDTLPAVEALRHLRESDNMKFPTRYVTMHVSADSTIVFDLRHLTKGGGIADFGRLMMFDILASNAASDSPRPVYWLSVLGPDKRLGLTAWTSPWSFGYRYGLIPQSRVDSLLIAESEALLPPNPVGRSAYMDHTPAAHVSLMRGALVANSRRLLEKGHIAEAVNIAEKADSLMGDDPGTYGTILMGDSAFNVRIQLSYLLSACADSIQNNNKKAQLRSKDTPQSYNDTQLSSKDSQLRQRAEYHKKAYEAQKSAWQAYRRALPRRLQNKMAPTY